MEYKLHVTNMMCEHCEKKVIKALSELNELSNIKASFKEEIVSFTCDNEKILGQVNKIIKKCGFKVK